MYLTLGIIGICIILILIFCMEGKRESKHLRIKEFNIKYNNLPKNIKIAVLSDFHCNLAIKDNIINAVNEIKPDIICVPGDLIKAKEKNKNIIEEAVLMLSELSRSYPVFVSFGNHEEKLKINQEAYKDNWYALGRLSDNENIYFLDNECLEYDGFKITGISLSMDYYKRIKNIKLPISYVNALIGESDNSDFNILLAHNPEYFETYKKWGANLIISGHNHGGLLRLPCVGGVLSSRLHPFPKFDYGLFGNENCYMLVSNGLGTHKPDIRVNNYPEIQVISLENAKN